MSDVLLPLTAKEKAVLEFIESYLQTHGIAPSYQEIRTHFGLASFNSVQRYLQQLQNKKYIYVPGGNLKRAITVLHSANEIQNSLSHGMVPRLNPNQTRPYLTQPERGVPSVSSLATESLALPLLGRVAAGRPLEGTDHNEFIQVPATMLRYPDRSYALRVIGESMIDDGILDGDIICVQRQEAARNGETVVAMINHQATVKKFYLHRDPQSSAQPDSAPCVELRPANTSMKSMWFTPDQVHIQGIVVGLLRQY